MGTLPPFPSSGCISNSKSKKRGEKGANKNKKNELFYIPFPPSDISADNEISKLQRLLDYWEGYFAAGSTFILRNAATSLAPHENIATPQFFFEPTQYCLNSLRRVHGGSKEWHSGRAHRRPHQQSLRDVESRSNPSTSNQLGAVHQVFALQQALIRGEASIAEEVTNIFMLY